MYELRSQHGIESQMQPHVPATLALQGKPIEKDHWRLLTAKLSGKQCAPGSVRETLS